MPSNKEEPTSQQVLLVEQNSTNDLMSAVFIKYKDALDMVAETARFNPKLAEKNLKVIERGWNEYRHPMENSFIDVREFVESQNQKESTLATTDD
jgi:hypothetical protein